MNKINDIELLWELQETEKNMVKIKCEFQNRQSLKDVEDASALLENSKIVIQSLEKDLAAEKKELRRLEMKGKEIAEDIRENNEKLYGGEVTATKELIQMEKKLKILAEENNSIEDLVIQQMEEIENKEKQLQEKIIEEKEKQDILKKLEKRDREESKKIKVQYRKQKEKKEQLEAQVSPQLLEKYVHLKKTVGPNIVAKVKCGVCLGCQVSLSSSTIGRLYTPGIILTCENCRKLIFLVD